MKIKNYLLDLDSRIYLRPGSDNIRIYGLGDLIKSIYKELKRFKSIKKIENEFKPHQTFSNWILNKNGIAIQGLYNLCQYWKITCEKSDGDLEELWNKVFHLADYFGCMNGKKIKLPKVLDCKLAYLLGVIFGDGHLADPDKSYDKLTSYNSELRITDGHEETFDSLRNVFVYLFDYKPKIYSEKSKMNKLFYRFVIKSKPLHRFVMVVCGMPTGDKRGKLRLPKIIKDAPLNLQKWFISGFFDADGCISLTKDKWAVIHITQYDTNILKEIIDISSKLGVNWLGPYCYKYKYNNCSIKIYNKKNIINFLNTFPSLNPNKLKQREILWKKLKKIRLKCLCT